MQSVINGAKIHFPEIYNLQAGSVSIIGSSFTATNVSPKALEVESYNVLDAGDQISFIVSGIDLPYEAGEQIGFNFSLWNSSGLTVSKSTYIDVSPIVSMPPIINVDVGNVIARSNAKLSPLEFKTPEDKSWGKAQFVFSCWFSAELLGTSKIYTGLISTKTNTAHKGRLFVAGVEPRLELSWKSHDSVIESSTDLKLVVGGVRNPPSDNVGYLELSLAGKTGRNLFCACAFSHA